jgi:hypothetical protein
MRVSLNQTTSGDAVASSVASSVAAPYDVFLFAYNLGGVAGVKFYHTAIVFCPPQDPLQFRKCTEMIFDSSRKGIHFKSGSSIGTWKKLQPEVRWMGMTNVEIAEVKREMSETCRDKHGNLLDFNKGTYHQFRHNCNYFTDAVLKYLNLGGLLYGYAKERSPLVRSLAVRTGQWSKEVVYGPVPATENCRGYAKK